MIGLRNIYNKLPNIGALSLLENIPSCNVTQVRHARKHWDPKFKKLRSQKVIKVKLLDFQELNRPADELTKEELRARMKERGLKPDRQWQERPVYISSTGAVFEPYVPPEGDGKVSAITTQGAKQKLVFIEKKSRSMLAVRKIRSYEEDFEFDIFLREAQDIYVKSHEAMMSKDSNLISLYVTERAYPEVVYNIGDKTIRWEFLESIEPPKVVHARCTDVITKDNMFGQITVRFHSRQILAVYDRFGRLLHGHEELPKDVLEYVVFEKHISNKYGRWRIHDKIIPDWMPPKEPSKKTHFIIEDDLQVTDVVPEKSEEKEEKVATA